LGVEEVLLALFTALSLALVVGKFLEEVVSRFGAPPVLGDLVAGLIVGPSLLAVYPVTEAVEGLSWLGILMLLLYAGIETRYRQFMRLAPVAAVLTAGEAVAAFGLGYLTGLAFGYRPLQSFFLGAVLEATSISVSVKTLIDIDRLTSVEGRTVLGVAVFDDITALITITAGSSLIREGGLNPVSLVRAAALALGFWLVTVVVLHRLSSRFMKLAMRLRTAEPVVVSVMALFSVMAVLSYYVGLNPLVAAYAVGLALSEARGVSRAVDKVRAMAMLFSILFFVTTAAQINLRSALRPEHLLFYLALISAAFAGKLLGGGLVSYLIGYPLRSSLRVAVGLFPRAEFCVIAAYVGVRGGLLGPEVYLAALLVVVVTNVLTPPLLKLVFRGEEVAWLRVRLFGRRGYV